VSAVHWFIYTLFRFGTMFTLEESFCITELITSVTRLSAESTEKAAQIFDIARTVYSNRPNSHSVSLSPSTGNLVPIASSSDASWVIYHFHYASVESGT
jgi:hypothetical protein